MNRFEWWYKRVVIFDFLYKTNVTNSYHIPKIKNIVINCGVKSGVQDPKAIIPVMYALKCISGQKPIYTFAKKSIANFKLRKGFPIGVKVTIRDIPSLFLLDNIIHIVLPRFRDFKGFSSHTFDQFGNISIGIHDLYLFPQVEYHYDLLPKDLGCTCTILFHSSKKTNISIIPKMNQLYLMAHQMPFLNT